MCKTRNGLGRILLIRRRCGGATIPAADYYYYYYCYYLNSGRCNRENEKEENARENGRMCVHNWRM